MLKSNVFEKLLNAIKEFKRKNIFLFAFILFKIWYSVKEIYLFICGKLYSNEFQT